MLAWSVAESRPVICSLASPINSYMPATITLSDAASIGSSFFLTPNENTGFRLDQWAL